MCSLHKATYNLHMCYLQGYWPTDSALTALSIGLFRISPRGPQSQIHFLTVMTGFCPQGIHFCSKRKWQESCLLRIYIFFPLEEGCKSLSSRTFLCRKIAPPCIQVVYKGYLAIWGERLCYIRVDLENWNVTTERPREVLHGCRSSSGGEPCGDKSFVAWVKPMVEDITVVMINTSSCARVQAWGHFYVIHKPHLSV